MAVTHIVKELADVQRDVSLRVTQHREEECICFRLKRKVDVVKTTQQPVIRESHFSHCRLYSV